jgi:hypothetical protein
MHLFKSEWLQEPVRRAADTYRDRGFAVRYGRRAFAPRLVDACPDRDARVAIRDCVPTEPTHYDRAA